MSKLENIGQKLYLNHFQIVTTLTIFYPKKKHVKKRHQKINRTSRTADKKMNNEVDGGFRPIS